MAKSKKSSKKSHLSTGQKVGLGVGMTAAAVAAAGTYFLYGSENASKNRKKVKSWSLKARAEVLEALEKAGEMSQEEYEDIVEQVGKAYASVREASKGDIDSFKKEMKKYWKEIEKRGKSPKKAAKKAVKKAKKTAKKAAKKATKKSK